MRHDDSGARMDYVVYHVVIPAGYESGLQEAFAAVEFHAFAVSTRGDGRRDLELYGIGGVLPPAVQAICTEHGIDLTRGEQTSEAALLANALDDAPCELCSGVWVDPTGSFVAPSGALVVHVPPSPAFGDGHHPSTRMAARLLMNENVAECHVLDLGCGTGVLGMIARQRGAARVCFSDIDPDSVRATRTTCTLNGYPEAEVLVSDLLSDVPDHPVKLIVANLYADLLLLVADDPKLERILPHGRLIVSGVAQDKCERVQTALAAHGFRVCTVLTDAWWNAMLLER